jgi:hypothetical protein
MTVLGRLSGAEPADDAKVRLKSNVAVKDSVAAVGLGHADRTGKPSPIAYGPYWNDPAAGAAAVSRSYDELIACQRLHFTDDDDGDTVRFLRTDDHAPDIHDRLSGPWRRYGDVKTGLDRPQKALLLRLLLADMIEIRG